MLSWFKIYFTCNGMKIFKDNEINVGFLKRFKDLINKNKKKYSFVIVCGGGSIARIYINGLKKINSLEKLQNFVGISVTRTNARFMSYFFNQDQGQGIPHKISEVKKLIKKQSVVFCGALEYHPHQTSDATAAQIALELDGEFINLTNVSGLHTSNPKTHKNAKLITNISWKNFHTIASKIDFKPGQHFVLDKSASKIILEGNIKTFILGDKLSNLEKLLNGKKFNGTLIYG